MNEDIKRLASKLKMIGKDIKILLGNVIVYKDTEDTTILRLGDTVSGLTDYVFKSINTPNLIITGTAVLRQLNASNNHSIEYIEIDLPNAELKNCNYMFDNCSKLKTVRFKRLDTSKARSMDQMFSYCKSLIDPDIEHIDTSSCEDMRGTFLGCESLGKDRVLDFSSWDVSKVKTFHSMFEKCKQMSEINLDGWKTTSAKSFMKMFHSCNMLKKININHFQTGKVSSLSGMFSGCQSLEQIDLTDWDIRKVFDMSKMFNECTKLKQIKGIFNWQIQGLVTAEYMFCGCRALEHIDISNWVKDEHIPISMTGIFCGCSNVKAIDMRQLTLPGEGGRFGIFSSCLNLKEIDIYSIKLPLLPSDMGTMKLLGDTVNLERIRIHSDELTDREERDIANGILRLRKIKDSESRLAISLEFNSGKVVVLD